MPRFLPRTEATGSTGCAVGARFVAGALPLGGPPTVVQRRQGRRRAGDRETLAAILFVATSGYTWRQLPPVGPCWQTV
ncbi:transposase [Streptomyces sp. CA-106110]|uniref:transposase n=1 Tax=Streptomyces sp. CA-106110 TaxID=3240044 RepID=UPI003D92A9E3